MTVAKCVLAKAVSLPLITLLQSTTLFNAVDGVVVAAYKTAT